MSNNTDNFFLIDHPLIKRDISILRDENTPQELFRAVVKRISIILANEISREFQVTRIDVRTPLELTVGHVLSQSVVLVPVLRPGLGMVAGFLEIIPESKVGHIGLQRDEVTLKPVEYYFKTPKEIIDSVVIILDPMLATGGSASEAVKFLKERGAKKIIFACIVACPEGVTNLTSNHPDLKIFCAAFDRQLNNKGYILPGLGDAGDRTFGTL